MDLYSENEIKNILNKIKNDVNDIKKMFKLIFLTSYAKNQVFEILNSPEKIKVYELTDGQHTTREISIKIGLSVSTINRWWRDWLDKGIASELFKKNKRYVQKNFSLDELGIEIPEIISNKVTLSFKKIPNKNELIEILSDNNMFSNKNELYNFISVFFKININNNKIYDKNYLNEIIINNFYNSSKRNQLIFMQALKQRAKDTRSPFLKYFEEWENRIKSEI